MSTQLEKWDSGGILLTYWCNAACADCYENSSPRKKKTMPLEDAKEYLKELKLLGCSGSRFHFAGGEPFQNYDHLIDCFKAAGEAGMSPICIETNAFWCTDDDLVRERLIEIKELGLTQLMVSCDVFHQEFVPLERVERAARIGREIVGENGVSVRFQQFLDDPIDVMKLTEEEKMDAFRDELRQRPERMAGRAATSLAHFVDRHPKETFANVKCLNPILKSRHIHIDPYGNVFPSVCSGLILSNAKKQRLSEIYETLDYNDRPVMKLLVENGPVPLLEEAIEHGFDDSGEGYASECHLCFVARMFLWEQGLYPDEIGPEEIYTD